MTEVGLSIYICIRAYIESYINYIFELTYFYTQVYIPYTSTYIYLISLSIQYLDMHIPYTPRLSYDKQVTHSLRMFVAGAQGCFAPQAPKVRKGWGLMGWIGEISRK